MDLFAQLVQQALSKQNQQKQGIDIQSLLSALPMLQGMNSGGITNGSVDPTTGLQQMNVPVSAIDKLQPGAISAPVPWYLRLFGG